MPGFETLWWFDGNHHTWHPTGLHSRGTRAPVYAVVCDPVISDIVYVATAAGVWKGRLSRNAGGPEWAWVPMANGLPEASVHDLSIFHDRELRLLRAAVSSRGVWEVDLAHPEHRARTFVRVHPHDTRRRPVALLVDPTRWKGIYRWDASPDVRVRRADRAPANLPPGEADLIELHGTDGGRRTDAASHPSPHRVRRGDLAVDVLVHHRDSETQEPPHLDPRGLQVPAQVGVLLLWREFPRLVPLNAARRRTRENEWKDLTVDFLPEVAALFRDVIGQPADSQRARAHQAAWRVPDWQVATPARMPAGIIVGHPWLPLDVRTPRSVTFNVTTTGGPNSYVLFMALVASTVDPLQVAPPATMSNADRQRISPPTHLENVVLWSHQVAVTIVRLTGG